MYALRRGFGDVLDPSAGTALDCGLFAGGVFNKACWCLQWPSLCSSDDYKAAYALAHPEVYSPILQPPAPPAVSAGVSDVPAPYSQDEYEAAVAGALAQQSGAWQAQNQATMDATAANLDAVAPPSSTNWALWGALALVGVFGFVALAGGTPGRYGR